MKSKSAGWTGCRRKTDLMSIFASFAPLPKTDILSKIESNDVYVTLQNSGSMTELTLLPSG